MSLAAINLGSSNGYATVDATNVAFGSSFSSSGVNEEKTFDSTKSNRFAIDLAGNEGSIFEQMNAMIKSGNIKQAMALRENLLSSAQDLSNSSNYANYKISESNLRDAIDKAYQQATGESLAYSVTENSDSSFMTGFKEGIPILGDLLANKESQADAMEQLSGVEKDQRETTKEQAGGIAGGAVGAAALAGIGIGILALTPAGWIGAGTALTVAGISAACGALWSGIKCLTGKIK